MKLISLLGIILLTVAFVQSGIVRRDTDTDTDDFDDEDDSEEVVWDEDTWYEEDEDGNLIEITDELGSNETLEETELLLPEKVFFHLYTLDNPSSSQEIYIGDDETLASSNWNSSKLTRIITHGWVNSKNSEACTLIRDAYLSEGDYNIIVVDWSKISKQLYGFARRRVYMVGGYVAKLIDYLETKGMDVSELIVIGHSLGGHIAGLTALQATNTVGYVIALDPALPYFWFSSSGSRVAKGDAAYVQVIHTNGGLLGIDDAIGDIDFYPNGGSSQNGCIVDAAGSCSHARAYKYMAESITSDVGFWGRLCKSWRRFRYGRCSSTTTTYMGGSTPTTETDSGSYYLRTARSSPYALGEI
ncbi:pancreatic triacylglycerol lipase-like [Neodiprion virginianus]|uniref:pancreatic triacylglycerol lipase-like n=1 Tax=Neodiprion virginianus TaxID=2961670 RepID=UPI001EE74233|nr:pancreatic triacylglycerol lipase-like [Neodiprion virginianus]